MAATTFRVISVKCANTPAMLRPSSGRRRSLSVAVAGGFKGADLLETLLARGEVSRRVKQLATEAAGAAGHERVLEILREAKGGSHD